MKTVPDILEDFKCVTDANFGNPHKNVAGYAAVEAYQNR
ncbi:hypothetical protein GFK82_00263 [Candidatus Steffania adelgidicola]|nr:hypothetical protein GFK82_00263 [Candidatus Steffania adelgidicola]